MAPRKKPKYNYEDELSDIQVGLPTNCCGLVVIEDFPYMTDGDKLTPDDVRAMHAHFDRHLKGHGYQANRAIACVTLTDNQNLLLGKALREYGFKLKAKGLNHTHNHIFLYVMVITPPVKRSAAQARVFG